MTTKYSSFSILGVGLILAIGGLIMFLDLALEPTLEYITARRSPDKRSPETNYARLEWNASTTLQLQRLAHEQVGAGDWKSSGWFSHPVTAPGEELAMFESKRENHPKLVLGDWADRPSTGSSDMDKLSEISSPPSTSQESKG